MCYPAFLGAYPLRAVFQPPPFCFAKSKQQGRNGPEKEENQANFLRKV